MPLSSIREHAPLYSAGIPARVEALLRGCGVPICDLTSAEWLAAGSGREWPNALVLFDSRAPASRANALGVREFGVSTLDVAPECSRFPAASSSADSDESLIAALKGQVEVRGFLWIQLSALPYPFQTVAWRSDDETTGESTGLLEWSATHGDYAEWTEYREGILVHVQSIDNTFQIECRVPNNALQPALEIWRGRHVACLPIQDGRIRIQERNLVFQLVRDQPAAELIRRKTTDDVSSHRDSDRLATKQ